MNENLIKVYNKLGGDATFGSINDFAQGLQDPTNLRKVYNKVGGDEAFGDISQFRQGIGMGQAQPRVRDIPVNNQQDLQALAASEAKDDIVGFGDYLKGLWNSSVEQGKQATILEALDYGVGGKDLKDLSEADIIRLTDSVKRQQKALKDVQGFQGLFREGDLLDGAEGLTSTLFEAIGGSLVSQATAAFSGGVTSDAAKTIGGATAAGAALGASGFITGPGGFATTAGGALKGAATGFGAAMIHAGVDVEFESILMDRIFKKAQELGLDPTDPKSFKSIISDEEFADGAVKDALTGAGIVGAADIITAGIASKVGGAGKLLRAASGKKQTLLGEALIGTPLSGTARTKLYQSGIESVGGSTGELLKQLAIMQEGESLNWKEIALEGVAESVVGLSEMGVGSVLNIPKTARASRARDMIINGAQNSSADEFAQGVDILEKSGGIDSETAQELKEEFNTIQEVFSTLPEEVMSNSVQRQEAVQSILDRTELDAEIELTRNKLKNTDEVFKGKVEQELAGLEQRREALNEYIGGLSEGTAMKTEDYRKKSVLFSRLRESEMSNRPKRDQVKVDNGEVTLAPEIGQDTRDIITTEAKAAGLTVKPVPEVVIESSTESTTEQTTTQTEEGPTTSTPEVDEGDIPTVKTAEEVTQESKEQFAQERKRQQEIEIELTQLFNEFQDNPGLDELTDESGGILKVLDSDANFDSPKAVAAAFKNMGSFSKKQQEVFGKENLNRAKKLYEEYSQLSQQLTPTATRDRTSRNIKQERGQVQLSPQETTDVRQTIAAAQDVAKARVKVSGKTLGAKVKSARNILKSEGIDVQILSEADYVKQRGSSSKGFFDTKTGTIFINKNKAGKNTVEHEVAHAKIISQFGQTGPDVTSIAESIKGALSEGTAYEKQLIKEINTIANKYKNKGDVDVRNHEFLAELASVLAVNKTEIQKRKGLAKRVIEAINNAISVLIGRRPIQGVHDVNEAIDFMNDLARKLRGEQTTDTTVEQSTAPEKLSGSKEKFDSLNRDTNRRDDFIRELFVQYPNITTQEITNLLNIEGVRVTAKEVKGILAEPSGIKSLMDIAKIDYGKSVANAQLKSTLEFMGRDLPTRMSGTVEQATHIASDKGYISEDLSAEVAIADTVMQGGGLNEYQTVALGHAIVRQRKKIAELAKAQETDPDAGPMVAKKLAEAQDMFELLAVAYAKAGNVSGRSQVFRKLLKFDDTTSIELASAKWLKKFRNKLQDKDVKAYNALVKKLGLASENLGKLADNLANRQEKYVTQLATQQITAISKKRGKITQSEAQLIQAIKDAYGSRYFDQIDPDTLGKEDIKKYRSIYNFAEHLVKNKGVRTLKSLQETIKKLDPSITDSDIVSALALANIRNNDGKLKTYQGRLGKLKLQDRAGKDLVKWLDTHGPNATAKQKQQFLSILDRLQQLLIGDVDQDGATLDETGVMLTAISNALAIFNEAKATQNKQLYDKAFALLKDNLLGEKGKMMLGIEAKIETLQEKMTELKKGGIPDTELKGAERALDKDILIAQDKVRKLRAELKAQEMIFEYNAQLEERLPTKNVSGVRKMVNNSLQNVIKGSRLIRDAAYELPRTLLFTADASFVMIQAGFSLVGSLGSLPIDLIRYGADRNTNIEFLDYIRAIPKTMRSAWVDTVNGDAQLSEDLYYTIISSPRGMEAKRYGVEFSRPGDPTSTEEIFRSVLASKVPAIRELTGISEKLYVNYMNLARISLFNSMVEGNPNLTEQQYKDIALFVNDATGRSTPGDGAIATTVAGMSKILAAPRLYISRVRMLMRNFPQAVTRFIASKGKDTASLEVIKSYAKFAFGQVIIGSILQGMLGWELEDDPNEPSFLKYKKEDKVLDLSHGMLSWLKIPLTAVDEFYRAETGKDLFGNKDRVQAKGEEIKTTKSSTFRMLSYKMHPTINAFFNVSDQLTTIGKPIGRNREERYWRALGGIFLPIPFQDGILGENTVIGNNPKEQLTDKQLEFLGPLVDRPTEVTAGDKLKRQLVAMTGAGVIDYKNYIRHHTVDMYLRDVPVYNKAGEQVRTGWDHNINKSRTAKAYITAASVANNGTNMQVDIETKYPPKGANWKGIMDGMKTDVQHMLGIWVLEQLNSGNPPDVEAMRKERDAILKKVAAVYYEEFK